MPTIPLESARAIATMGKVIFVSTETNEAAPEALGVAERSAIGTADRTGIVAAAVTVVVALPMVVV